MSGTRNPKPLEETTEIYRYAIAIHKLSFIELHQRLLDKKCLDEPKQLAAIGSVCMHRV